MRTRLLGGLEIEGLRPTQVGSRKARTLVKVLALGRGAPVPAARVVDALWGDQAPARPLEQVGVLVSRLRGVLGADRLDRDDTGWSLRCDWLDVVELDDRVREAADRLAAGRPAAARAAARAALALVRGELLADEPEARWAEAERVVVARQVACARVLAAEAALAMGDPAQAVVDAEAALDREPYDEVALRLLLRAQVAAGRPAAALATYARARARLAEDLGADPAPATAELHAEILRTGGNAAGRSAGVPAPRTAAFVGRAAELAALDRRLSAVAVGGAALVEVVGEAGIGKTALVTRWAAAAAGRAAVLAGRCDEPGATLPLQPVLDALDAHLRERGPDAARDLLGADAPVVAPLLTGPGADAAPSGTSPTALADPITGRALLFAALLRILARAGGGRPAVLVVDDVGRADPATAAWLRFAARRGTRLLLVTTRRERPTAGQPGSDPLALGPLDRAEVAELVGPERAGYLHARSGGNPLFLGALAAADPDALPATVRASVDGRAAAIGPAGMTLRTAAVLGPDIDVDLLAAVLGLGVRELLTHLEAGVEAQLVDDRGAALAFVHDLVRTALADPVTPTRRAFVHREAAAVLAGRPRADPLAVARHARLGGDAELAADALVAAAGLAAARHDLASALEHLDGSIALVDRPDARAARARVHLLRLDLAAAAADADRALTLGAGPECLELAGWVAYYRRDYDAAMRLAEAGRERASDDQTRASCALLLGRLHHTRGALATADELLAATSATTPGPARAMARVWLASLRGHQGRAEEASRLAERALVEPELAHPFATGHALFAAIYARGLRGDPVGTLALIERFERFLADRPEQAARFAGIVANLRGWVLRAVGRMEEARESHAVAVALPPGPMRDEPRVAGALDLVDERLAAGDPDGAAATLARAGWIPGWQGSMSWRQQHRYALLSARLALASGDAAAAADGARAVLTDAGRRGAPRYRTLAAIVAGRAAAVRGGAVDHAALDRALGALDAVAGLEAWWVTAEAAAAFGADRWWALADRRAAALVAAAGPDADSVRREVARRFAMLGRR